MATLNCIYAQLNPALSHRPLQMLFVNIFVLWIYTISKQFPCCISMAIDGDM